MQAYIDSTGGQLDDDLPVWYCYTDQLAVIGYPYYPDRHKTGNPYCSFRVEFSFYNFIDSGDLFHINSYIVFLEMIKRIIRTNIFLKILVTIATKGQIITWIFSEKWVILYLKVRKFTFRVINIDLMSNCCIDGMFSMSLGTIWYENWHYWRDIRPSFMGLCTYCFGWKLSDFPSFYGYWHLLLSYSDIIINNYQKKNL